jgi:uncharacterized protein YegP (UPF0339 family)
MGVGVLIGRSSAPKQSATPEIVNVGGGTSTGGSTEESFTGDWTSTTKGFTVQLETLPESGTSVASVESAKTAATGKGASSVGALKSSEFSSLASGNYVIYSGEYHTRAEAQKALGSLKKKFPSATVIEVAKGSASKSAGSSSESKAAKTSTSEGTLEHPAPASTLEGEQKSKGKSYEEKSKELPDVVEG